MLNPKHKAKIITYNQLVFLTLLIQGRCLYETYKILNNKDFLLSKFNRHEYRLHSSSINVSSNSINNECLFYKISYTLSALIRKIHDEYVFEKHTPPEWKDQLNNLNDRMMF